MDAIKELIAAEGFTILNERQYQMTPDEAERFYKEHTGKPFFGKLIAFMTSGETVALQLQKEGAIAAWRALCGPTNSEAARADAPESLRARFGTGAPHAIRCLVHKKDRSVAGREGGEVSMTFRVWLAGIPAERHL